MKLPKAPPGQPSFGALFALMTASTHEHSLDQATLGFEKIGKGSLNSIHVMRGFFKVFPEWAEAFCERAGIDPPGLQRFFLEDFPEEPQPDPPVLQENPTREQAERFEVGRILHRSEIGGGAVFTRPVREALRLSRNQVTEEKTHVSPVGSFLAELLEGESNARSAVLSQAGLVELQSAIGFLRSGDPSPLDKPFPLPDFQAQARKVIERAWPKIDTQAWKETERLEDRLYEKDPSRYEMPVDIAAELARPNDLSAERDYNWRGGLLLRAAGNEARIRKAPQATLDHLFFALLRDGTDTAAFLDEKGIERKVWRDRLDAELPRFEEGPRWPRNDRALTFGIHQNSSLRFQAHPEGKEPVEFDLHEMRQLSERVVDRNLRFTDLRHLRYLHDEPQTIAFRLFAEAGIMNTDLKSAIAAFGRRWPKDEG
ncbi:hypothetical protein EON81_07305 [bacterium]|nr:MAG: hypothetical protein EON81_07305 [bacterium]